MEIYGVDWWPLWFKRLQYSNICMCQLTAKDFKTQYYNVLISLLGATLYLGRLLMYFGVYNLSGLFYWNPGSLKCIGLGWVSDLWGMTKYRLMSSYNKCNVQTLHLTHIKHSEKNFKLTQNMYFLCQKFLVFVMHLHFWLHWLLLNLTEFFFF